MRTAWVTFWSTGITVFALSAAVYSAPSPKGALIVVNTEVASIYMFHPDDLQHRKSSPMGWSSYGFTVEPEFGAGNLVAFVTGSDGTYQVRLTEGELTARERKYFSCAWEFRYKVRHNGVLIDGGEFLPEDRGHHLEESPAEDQWYAIANGNYKVTVSAIDWSSEPGAVDSQLRATKNALSAYVIQFKKVDKFDAIAVAPSSPRLEPEAGAKPEFYPISADKLYYADERKPLPKTCRVFVARDMALVPGFETPTNAALGEFSAQLDDEQRRPGALVAFVDSERVPQLGAVGYVSSTSEDGRGNRSASFALTRLVSITKIDKGSDGLTGTITDYSRPGSEVAPSTLAALKTAFKAYASSNEAYRKAVDHPDFESELVGAMSSPSAISTTLLHHIQMPAATRSRLLPLSDGERIKELMQLLAPR